MALRYHLVSFSASTCFRWPTHICSQHRSNPVILNQGQVWGPAHLRRVSQDILRYSTCAHTHSHTHHWLSNNIRWARTFWFWWDGSQTFKSQVEISGDSFENNQIRKTWGISIKIHPLNLASGVTWDEQWWWGMGAVTLNSFMHSLCASAILRALPILFQIP